MNIYARCGHTLYMVIFYAAAVTYIVAINIYAVIMLKKQKNADNDERRGDGRIILAAALGGALGVYVAMFVMRYRLENLVFMVMMPVLAAVNLCMFYALFRRLPLMLALA